MIRLFRYRAYKTASWNSSSQLPEFSLSIWRMTIIILSFHGEVTVSPSDTQVDADCILKIFAKHPPNSLTLKMATEIICRNFGKPLILYGVYSQMSNHTTFNVLVPSTTRYEKWHLLVKYSYFDWNVVCISHPSWPAHQIFLDFVTLITLVGEYKSWGFSLRVFKLAC